nr:glycosyltransferase [Phaeobacter sp. HF9A]
MHKKPHNPEFDKFVTSVMSQERAKFAFDMKNGFRSPAAKGETPQRTAKNLLRAAQNHILSHELEKAKTALRQAIALDENNSALHSLLGEVFMKDDSRLADALSCMMRAIKLEPKNSAHFAMIGTLLMRMKKFEEAIGFFEIAVSYDPNNYIALSRMMHLKAHRLQWDHFGKIPSYLKRLDTPGVVSDPFAFLSLCDDGAYQRRRSEAVIKAKFGKPATARGLYWPRNQGQKIRIGYFSNDFHDHATMHLMFGLLEAHDREKFDIYMYDYGSAVQDREHHRARKNAGRFQDVRHMTTTQLVDLARGDQIDIAVDLKGFTEGGRLDIFNARVAPVQVAYLGYPGTTGLKSMDYMVADKATIPAHLRKLYSEHILYMPHCYQPNDDHRKIADIQYSRAQFNLPETGFVFSSFNSPYKVTPREYDLWMALLKEVPDSVLWFYTGTNDIEQRLKAEAEKRGVDGARIIPTGRLKPELHLARLRLADLFLDTFNVNAHTTASDALWAGLPVVTKMGEQFAARVAGSILQAAGLPDLVTQSEKKYFEVALRIAQEPDYLADIRNRIAAARENAPLFDTAGYTRDFERLLEHAFEHYLNGNAPKSMAISA